MRNPQIARFRDVEDEFYSADGHVYGAWGGPEHEDIALVPDHVGVEEPRTELGEFQWGFHLDGGPFIARRFRPDELVITDLPHDDEPDRRRFFTARDDELLRQEGE